MLHRHVSTIRFFLLISFSGWMYDLQYIGETKQQLSKRLNGHRSDASCKPDFPLSRHLRSTGHHDSFAKLKVTIIDHNPKLDDKSREEMGSFWIRKLKTLSSNGINKKSNIFSWVLILLVSSGHIRTYSLLNWPKVYIPHYVMSFIEWVWVSYRFQTFLNVLNVYNLFYLYSIVDWFFRRCIYILLSLFSSWLLLKYCSLNVKNLSINTNFSSGGFSAFFFNSSFSFKACITPSKIVIPVIHCTPPNSPFHCNNNDINTQ